MNDKVSKILKYALSASAALIFLWFSFRDVEWSDFAEGLRSFRLEFVVLSMLAGAVSFWLRGLRWRRLLLPVDPSVTRMTAFNGVNIANISNFVFPRLGEFVRCGVITRRSSVSYDKVLGTVVLERCWELLVMILLLCVVIFAGFDRFGGFFMNEVWAPLSSKWWVIPTLLAVMLSGMYLLWTLRERNALCKKVWGVIKGILQGFTSCFHMEKKWLFFAYTLLIWLVYWLMSACIVWASTSPDFASLNIIDALFISLIGGLGFAIPVPGGIGAFHFIIQLALFQVYGIPKDVGLVFATVSHTSQALTQIIFGLFSYGYEAIKR